MQPEIIIAIISAVVAISASIVAGYVKVQINGQGREIDALRHRLQEQDTAFQGVQQELLRAQERIRKLERCNRQLRLSIRNLENENTDLQRRLHSRSSGTRGRKVNDDPTQTQ